MSNSNFGEATLKTGIVIPSEARRSRGISYTTEYVAIFMKQSSEPAFLCEAPKERPLQSALSLFDRMVHELQRQSRTR